MIRVHGVEQVREAEERAFAIVPPGELMRRAAHALALECVGLLRAERGTPIGASVLVMAGSGNNGGDALWAGALLARRGCRVDALTLADHVHAEGAAALRRAGGRVRRWNPDDAAQRTTLARADLALDGIVGIGGTGGLRPAAALLVAAAAESGALIVAVDVPSGVDPDSGAVAGDAVTADVTVTFGCLKPGLVVAPGSLRSGRVHVIDIGLDLPAGGTLDILEARDVARWVPAPQSDAYKYARGVVGVSAGSVPYPGAALLATSAARLSNVGMVRFLDRSDGAAASVVQHYPDIVVDGSDPTDQARADAWACGPGFVGDHLDALTVSAVLATARPVVLDAGALSVVADDADIRSRLAERHRAGLLTVITPHQGEFERILPGLLAASSGRVDAARAGAARLSAVVVLKGPGTVIAAPDGRVLVDVEGTADLGTAGSGDVLAGLIGALLAGAWSAGRRHPTELTEAVAAAVWLHGAAGRIAGRSAPVVATDVSAAIPDAIRRARGAAAPAVRGRSS